MLEYDDYVINFITQPVTINYIFEKHLRRYTPDAIVYYDEVLKKQPLICEIKYAEELEKKAQELKPKFDAANEYCLLQGYQFKVVTEKEIRTDHLSNIKFLSSYYYGVIDRNCSIFVQEEIDRRGFITPEWLIGKQVQNGFDDTKVLRTLWQMIAQKLLKCDMDIKITMTSRVWVAQQ